MMKALGIDLNATTARAVHGKLNQRPNEIPLDASNTGLPMVLNLKAKSPRVGQSGLELCRVAPHFAYDNFFGDLSLQTPRERRWWTERSNLNATRATEIVMHHLKQSCPNVDGATFTLPGYFTGQQRDTFENLAQKARFPIWGSVSAPLAVALHTYSQSAWSPAIVVVDVDDHAMTIAIVDSVQGQGHVRQTRVWGHLAWRHWVTRTINNLAEFSIMQNRKDPRANALADQGIFDQIGDIFNRARDNLSYTLEVRAKHWFFQLTMAPQQIMEFCAPMLNETIQEIRSAWQDSPYTVPEKIFLTHRAGLLPGLVSRLRNEVHAWNEPDLANGHSSKRRPEDFGDHLMRDIPDDVLTILPADALARGSHLFAGLIQQGVLPKGHYDSQISLFLPQPISA